MGRHGALDLPHPCPAGECHSHRSSLWSSCRGCFAGSTAAAHPARDGTACQRNVWPFPFPNTSGRILISNLVSTQDLSEEGNWKKKSVR